MTFEVSESFLVTELNAAGRLSPDVVRAYAAQLVHTLAYLQTLEIMHRDLKPMNILLDDDYNIKIVSVDNKLIR